MISCLSMERIHNIAFAGKKVIRSLSIYPVSVDIMQVGLYEAVCSSLCIRREIHQLQQNGVGGILNPRRNLATPIVNVIFGYHLILQEHARLALL